MRTRSTPRPEAKFGLGLKVEQCGTDKDHVDSRRTLLPEGPAVRTDSGEPGLQLPDGSSGVAPGQAGGRVTDGAGSVGYDLGATQYEHLVAAFLGDLALEVALLGDAAAVGDIPAARYVAHQIKGTAPSFGAADLEELADRVLQIPRDQSELLARVVEEIVKEAHRLKELLTADPATGGSEAALPASPLTERVARPRIFPVR
jgi:HPt (histidine-containing phosphotransfer) domain-containing protein